MPEDISARNITKFDGQNFQCWKFQVRALFTVYGVQDVVSGDRTMPEEVAGEEAAQVALRQAWKKDNARAMYLMSSTLESKQLEPLIVCTTAKDMWGSLVRVHERTSSSNRLMLTQKFHEYRMYPGDSVVNHIAKV